MTRSHWSSCRSISLALAKEWRIGRASPPESRAGERDEMRLIDTRNPNPNRVDRRREKKFRSGKGSVRTYKPLGEITLGLPSFLYRGGILGTKEVLDESRDIFF